MEPEISRKWITAARSRVAARRGEKPSTKAAQIRALWPEIKAALAEDQSVTTICKWLEEDAGIKMSLTSLTSYISRIRRRENQRVGLQTGLPIPPSSALNATDRKPIPNFDPLANVRARQAKRTGFDYHPATTDDIKDLI